MNTNEINQQTLQEKFDADKSNEFNLSPGEYQGALKISRPCVINGNRSTLWAKLGPVILVKSPGVVIKNLRVEITEDASTPEEKTAIKTISPDTKLINIEVSGDIKGFPNEPDAWNLPRIIKLGSFAADKANSIAVNINAASDCEIVNNIKDTKILPEKLAKGSNKLIINISALKDNTILYGNIFIKTLVTRRIYITGRSVNGAKEFHDTPAPPAPPAKISPAFELAKRGQRFSLDSIKDGIITIEFTQDSIKKDFDLDAYIFMLRSDNKVRSDDDLIFWGSQVQNQAIKLDKTKIFISPSKVDPEIEKISVCFSIYGDNPAQNFSLSINPAVNIYANNKNFCRFEFDSLNIEKSIIALELYRYNGSWKINFVGAGWKNGLKQLCENFGLEVMNN